jgi:hypothetical protein
MAATIDVHLMLARHVVICDAWDEEFVYILLVRRLADNMPKPRHWAEFRCTEEIEKKRHVDFKHVT